MIHRKYPHPEKFPQEAVKQSILVICETWDGRVTPPSLALVGHARAIARGVTGINEICGVVFGQVENLDSTLGPCGANRVFRYPSASSPCDPSLVVGVVERLARHTSASLALCVRSPWGDDVAPRIAAGLQALLVSNCVGLDWAPDKGLLAIQAIQGGRLYRECPVPGEGMTIISWNPEALGRHEREEDSSAEVVELPRVSIPESAGVRSVRVVEGDPETMSLEEADRVLAFGRGMDCEDLPALQELAREMRAAVGGTRPVIDAGLLPFERQIGQTGATVAPRLLLAWGISGANEFTVGIEHAQIIIAVNKDAQARIFGSSDLGLVGDGKAVLRQVLNQLRAQDRDAGTNQRQVP